jgi:hypothetical protein
MEINDFYGFIMFSKSAAANAACFQGATIHLARQEKESGDECEITR